MFQDIFINMRDWVARILPQSVIYYMLFLLVSAIAIANIVLKLHKWALENVEKSCASFILYFLFKKWGLFSLWAFSSLICSMQLGIFGFIFGELIKAVSDCAATGKTMDEKTIFLNYEMSLYMYFIIIFIVSTLGIWSCCILNAVIRSHLLSWMVKDIRLFFIENILQNNYEYFENTPKGDTIGSINIIITSSVSLIDKFFKEILSTFIYMFIGLYTFSHITASFNILFLIWLIIHLFCVFIRLGGYVYVSKINAKLYIQLMAKIENVINNIVLVKTNNTEKFESKYIGKFNEIDINSWQDVMTYNIVSISMVDTIYYAFFSCISIYFLVHQWSIGLITIGGISQIQSISRNIGWRIWNATNEFATMIFEVERINKALSAIAEDNKYICNQVKPDNIQNDTQSDPAIELRDVCFAYPGNKHSLLLNQFNLKIPRNSKIGIIGRSGSGKSTIVSLIMKFFTPTKGDIFINGINIANLTPDEINESISYVSNKELVLSRSILENIGYGCKIIREEIIEIINQKGFVLFDDLSKASQERIVFYAKKARAHQFITRSLKGYDTILSVDCNLSSGEKQRLALARALIKESPILILDEATSALDGDNEDEIAKTLESINDKTIIVIAHGFNLIRNYNLIIVMNSGALIEAGTHKALLEQKGVYYDLYNRSVT